MQSAAGSVGATAKDMVRYLRARRRARPRGRARRSSPDALAERYRTPTIASTMRPAYALRQRPRDAADRRRAAGLPAYRRDDRLQLGRDRRRGGGDRLLCQRQCRRRGRIPADRDQRICAGAGRRGRGRDFAAAALGSTRRSLRERPPSASRSPRTSPKRSAHQLVAAQSTSHGRRSAPGRRAAIRRRHQRTPARRCRAPGTGGARTARDCRCALSSITAA
jgi:hypothetical protein